MMDIWINFASFNDNKVINSFRSGVIFFLNIDLNKEKKVEPRPALTNTVSELVYQ